MKHSEESIIKYLYVDFMSRKHSIMCHNNTNTLYYVGESDFISVTKKGMIHEIEIKISKADFKNDFTKKDRHLHLSRKSVHHLSTVPTELRSDHTRYMRCVEIKKYISESLPNYFYYAMPEGIVEMEDIPDYCGVILINEQGYGAQVRNPKRIHKEPITMKQLFSLGRSLTYRMSHCKKYH